MYPEDILRSSLYNQNSERTFIDKMLGRRDVETVLEVIVKKRLTRSDISKVYHMLSSPEIKIVNLSEGDRYIINKFFIWIGEFIKLTEQFYDYYEDTYRKTKLCSCGGWIEIDEDIKEEYKNYFECKCEKSTPSLNKFSPKLWRLLENQKRHFEYSVKFLASVYLNIIRSGLSVGATGFMELLNNRFEMSYPSAPMMQQQQEQRRPLMVRKS